MHLLSILALSPLLTTLTAAGSLPITQFPREQCLGSGRTNDYSSGRCWGVTGNGLHNVGGAPGCYRTYPINHQFCASIYVNEKLMRFVCVLVRVYSGNYCDGDAAQLDTRSCWSVSTRRSLYVKCDGDQWP